MSQPTRQINALTALRFFAALLVVIFHHGQAPFATAPSWCQAVIKGGYVGVPFFFVLSGFILAYNYLPGARTGMLDNGQFWLARFARIYPVYAFALLLSAPFLLSNLWQVFSPGDALAQFGLHTVLCFGLIHAWTTDWAFTWNGPAWSLSVEAFFYLAFPFLIKHLTTRGRWSLLAGFFCGAACLIGAGRLFGWNISASAQHWLGWTNPTLWLALFLLGICVGDLHLAHDRVSSGTTKHTVTITFLTLGTIAIILWAITSGLQSRSQLLLCYAVTMPCALLIYLLGKEGNPISRLLDFRTLVLLGEASYSLYILHRPIHDWFGWIAAKGMVPTTETSAGFAIYLAICLGASVLTLKWIEYPCREWIKRCFTPRISRQDSPGRITNACEATMIR